MTVTSSFCRACGSELPVGLAGRPRSWCDNACKMRGRKMAEAPRCRSCGEIKSPEEFVQDPRYKSGHQPWCSTCRATYRADRRERSRAIERESKYGIGLEAQIVLFDAQGEKCAGCRTGIELADAHLDHCHATGKVRGFLCPSCNLTLGQAQESRERLLGLVAYLDAHQ